MKQKNKNITIEKDNQKSYVYIKDGSKDIGYLYWHYKKRKWFFNRL